jgi:predicted RNA-binding protein with PIN domain
MALQIIIDGYNLIRQSPYFSALDRQDIASGRKALLDRLAVYKSVRGHRITVVFDGTGTAGFIRHRDRRKGIEVIYSNIGESADAVITNLARRKREKALVVSSDREVIDACSGCGAATIDSPAFEERMMLADRSPAPVADDPDLPGWVPTTRKRGPRRRLPRKRRRNRRKIEKL